MMRSCLLLLCCVAGMYLPAQSLSGIVNSYTAVISIDSCLGSLRVTDTSGFHKDDLVLIIQMQGAGISTANNSGYGAIQAMNGAGKFEKATIDSVGADVLFVRHRLVNVYQTTGHVQVVRIARFASAVVSDTLRALPWNGQVGGIVALEIEDTLVLNAPIIADGAGFRGGAATVAPVNNCNFLIPETAYFYSAGNWRGSLKGEGIAASEAGKELGRGPQANGGGGGNDHNAGGGGGAHIGRGGLGGNNDEPSSLGCDGYYPGIGGYQVADDALRLFIGGGGGAGHANNGFDGSGGAGGGIILIQAASISGSQPILAARGTSAGTANGDGGGGGGAGGTIWLETQQAPPNLQMLAGGGNGGNTSNNNANRCFGPGGGGGGGRIVTNLSGFAVPTGGIAGIVTASLGACQGSSNGAATGQNGRVDTAPAFPEGNQPLAPEWAAQPLSDTVCEATLAYFLVKTNPGDWHFQWQYNPGSGWQNIETGTGWYGINQDSVAFSNVSASMDGWMLRAQASRPGCYTIVSEAAELRVGKAPVAGFSAAVDGQTVSFSNESQGGDGYLWDFGDGQFSTDPEPQHTYENEGVFPVSLRVYNTCDTVEVTNDIQILLLPNAAFTAPDSVAACGPALVSFQNTSSENSQVFQWYFPGGSPETSGASNPEITYSTTGAYDVVLIVSNNAGSDTFQQTIHIQILAFPSAQFGYVLLPDGMVQFTGNDGSNAELTWDFGDGSPVLTSADTVTHQYANGTYTVSLVASNSCGASVLQQMIEVTSGSVGIHQEDAGLGIRIYPNPANSFLVVDATEANIMLERIRLLDLSGRMMLEIGDIQEPKTTMLLSPLPAGAYWLEITAEMGKQRRIWIKQ